MTSVNILSIVPFQMRHNGDIDSKECPDASDQLNVLLDHKRED